MADLFSEARLEVVLMSVGEHLVVDAPVPAKRASSVWPRRLAIAAAVVVALLVVTMAIAPVREAVADWLGIGSTHIVKVEGGIDATDLPTIRDGLKVISRADAETALRAPLPEVPVLGEPDVLVRAPEGGVVMGWAKGDTTLWVHGMSLEPGPFLDKLLAAGERVEPVEGVGEDALYVEGTHVLETPARRLAARSVLLWVEDGREYRLESDLARDELIEIAKSVSPG